MKGWIGVFGVALLASGLAQQTVTLRAWTIGPEDASKTRATNLVEAAEELNRILEAEKAPYRVRVETSFETTNWDNYHRRLLLAFQSGQAPDIVQTTHVDIGAYAEGGYIVPLEEYLGRYRTLQDVTPALWSAVTYRGKRYGVPQDTEARPLYFNKPLLAKLGWSSGQIAGLAQAIREGRFTWEDLIRVGQEAVQKGVVRPGYAYWHRPVNGPDFYQFYYACGGTLQNPQTGKLVLDRTALGCMYGLLGRLVQTGVMTRNLLGMTWDNWHNTVSSGQVLFASAGTWTWAQWATQYYAKDHGGYDYLWQTFGFALQPAVRPGGKPVTLSQPQAYLVTAASRNKELAVRLLNLVTQPKYDAKHALGSAHLPILRTTYVLPEVRSHRFLQSVRYMLDYTTYQAMSPDWGVYADAVFRGISAVESGQLSPEAAVDLVAKDLGAKLGDRVEVR
jgi:inositol-phosphate transport system substrate-binding protein